MADAADAAKAAAARVARATDDKKRKHELESKLRTKIKGISTLRKAKARHSEMTDSDPIDKMGTMLDPSKTIGWSNFRVKDKNGRVLEEPRVAMIMEELEKVAGECFFPIL